MPWDLQNRAETQARTSFSLIRLIAKKCSKLIQKASILEAPGTPQSQKLWKNEPRKIHEKIYSGKHRIHAKKTKMAFRNRPKSRSKIDVWGAACQQGCKTWILEVRGGFSGFRGYPRGQKLIKNVEKTALPNAWKKRYVMLSSFHTLSYRDRNAIQPWRKERSSAQYY